MWTLMNFGVIKWCSFFRKQLKVPQKVKNRVTIRPSNFTPCYIPKRTENICPHKHLHTNVYGSIILSGHRVETNETSMNWRTDTHCAMHILYYMVYYSAIKRNEVLIYGTKWINLENMILTKKNWTQKKAYLRILIIWNIQNRHIHRDKK